MSVDEAQRVQEAVVGWMPPTKMYLAMAEAMHDQNDLCNANQNIDFDECAMREADIEDAVRILTSLRRDGWLLVMQPVGVRSAGL